MQMTPDARAWLDQTVARILARHNLNDLERAGVHYEIMSHLHSAAEKRASDAGHHEITTLDFQSALAAMGGEEELARAFVQRLARPVERVLFWRRFGAMVIDWILIGIVTTFLNGVLYLVMAPIVGGTVYRSSPFEPDGSWWVGPFDHMHTASAGAFVYDALGALIWFGAMIGYFTWIEAREGRSLGKRALGMRVVRVDGAPMTYRESFIRNVVKAIPPLLLLDTLIMLLAFRKEKQRVSDRVAETIVVRA